MTPRYRGRTIHEQDPLLNAPCDVCGEPLLLGDTVLFEEDDGSHAWHERHHDTLAHPTSTFEVSPSR